MMNFLRKLLPFLTRSEKKRVAEAIEKAESATTGEIHVHVTSLASPKGALEQAESLFLKLGLDKTAQRNGVLILVAAHDKKFAIWGDAGIHQAAGQPLWDQARQVLQQGLSQGHHASALEACVAEVGRALTAHFPRGDGPNPNELPDAVTQD